MAFYTLNISNVNRLLTTAAMLLCSLLTFAQFSGSGAGTESGPYPIQLNQMRNYLTANTNSEPGTYDVTAGTKKQISIGLENPDRKFVAFQFDMELPEGLSVTKNNNNLVASLNADRIDDHLLAVSELSGNVYRFLSYSMSNAEIKGSNGTLINVTISSSKDIPDGQYDAKLLSQVFTDASGNQYNLDDVTFNISIVTPVISDENKMPKVKLSKTKAIVSVGKSGTLKATVYPETLADKSVTWKSSNKKVATVTSKGKVKTVGVGTATITCTSVATDAKATCKVTVGKVVLSKTEATVPVGKSGTLKATVYPTTLADKSLTWKSSDTKVATVTSKGKVTAVGVGTATITCTYATGLSATCTLTVGKVVLNKTKATVRVGKSGTLKATVYPETLEDKSVTWKSSNKKVATVTSAGKVKTVGVGTATITCTSVATGLSATFTVTVIASASARSLGGGDDELTSFEDIQSAVTAPFDVYDLSGHKVKSKVNSLDGLPRGIYIINGKKVMK
jgi:uncharacterized protein YjdB